MNQVTVVAHGKWLYACNCHGIGVWFLCPTTHFDVEKMMKS
jgi:hypothetical protein